MGLWKTIQIDIIQEIETEINNSLELRGDAFCILDAQILERAAERIRDSIEASSKRAG